MILILAENEDIEYYENDKNMSIYRYMVPDLPTVLRTCFKGDVPSTVVAKSNR